MPEITIDVAGGRGRGPAADFHAWALKRDAAAALRTLRDQGLNTDDNVRIHPAVGQLGYRFWIIARPDPLAEHTWLMRADGSWCRGRLHDNPAGPATWTHHPLSEPIPATVTHNYRYSAGSEPVCDGNGRTLLNGNGTERLDWFATARCVVLGCGWKIHDTTEHVVRTAARAHRRQRQEQAAATERAAAAQRRDLAIATRALRRALAPR